MGEMLYLECTSGLSGDMAVAALLDLGNADEKKAREQAVRRGLASLPVQGFAIEVSRVQKAGIDACDFDVVLDDAHANHDHDMDYLYGHLRAQEGGRDRHAHGAGTGHAHDHDHAHAHAHAHDHVGHVAAHDHDHSHTHVAAHDHDHAHAGHVAADAHADAHDHDHAHSSAHTHEHRGLADVVAIIEAADITESAKELATRIFAIVAEAEAEAHALPVNEVHFHEVGAIDSIADIVAFAVAFDTLHVEEVVVRELVDGTGTVRCQHGVIPVPVPAVANIVKAHALPLSICEVPGEMVTPTGAAIAAAVRTRAALPESFVILDTGIGAGKRDYGMAGVARAMLISQN